MSLPFGIDLKSLIVGMLIVWFVVPWVMGMMNRTSSKSAQS
jgi:antibiotic biosynthesis monooxygenase (ABM) superfamily enzyme